MGKNNSTKNFYSENDMSAMEDAFILGRIDKDSRAHGRNYLHYKEVFEAFRLGQAAKWNWANFIFGSFHLLYRKQFLWGFISLALTFALVKFPPYLLIQALVLGLFGDYLLYQKFCSICEKQADKKNKDIDSLLEIMKKKGGRSVVFSVILAVVSIVALIALTLVVWGIGSLASLIIGLFH